MNTSESFYRRGSNLASYRQIGDHRSMWEAYWGDASLERSVKAWRGASLGEFAYPFTKYLPRDGTIIEAGCGTCRYVITLSHAGYNIEGIDFAAETIRRVKECAPGLDIRSGDVLAIDRPDGYYAAYISIGVVEHFYEGPRQALAEAHRVLRPGGVALISVPDLNVPRRLKYAQAQTADTAELSGGQRFYQDFIDRDVFRAQLKGAGFTLLEEYPYELYGGFIRDRRIGRYLHARRFFWWRNVRVVRKICENAPGIIKNKYCHMRMYICTK